MAALADVMSKRDACELTDLIVDDVIRAGYRDALIGWVTKSSRAADVRAGGGVARRVLKAGSPARARLTKVLAEDWEALRGLLINYVGTAVKAQPNGEIDEAAEEEARHTPFGELLGLLSGEEQATEYQVAELAPRVLEALLAARESGVDTEPVPDKAPELSPVETAHLSPQADLKELKRRIKGLEDKLDKKCIAERTLSRNYSQLKTQHETLVREYSSITEREGHLARELDTLKCATRREHVSDAGRITQLKSENARLAVEVAALKGDLQERDSEMEAATDYVDSLERERLGLQTEIRRLTGEIERRLSVADLFADAPPEHALDALEGLSSTIGSLKQFVSSAVEAKREFERQQREAAERAQAELIHAAQEAARRDQEEASWSHHLAARAEDDVARFRSTLFRDGVPAHIVIDGHNLILRRFRPEMERTSRPWLERMVCEMAEDLDIDTRLVFDCPEHAASHSDAICSGVRRYFHSKAEGGADAKIAQIVREFRPEDFTIVVSSDHRHVWTDALEARDEGYNVEPIGVELLHNYLVALDELARVVA